MNAESTAHVVLGGAVLELCCGDGFNARNFYSLRSREVTAIDYDAHVLRTARRKNAAPNVQYLQADIRTQLPARQFDNVIWDAAIEHFTDVEIRQLVADIKKRLAPGGILSGHTLVGAGPEVFSHHEIEFKDKGDLLRFLTPHFRNVCVFETKYPKRHNLYFWASDDSIPFGEVPGTQ